MNIKKLLLAFSLILLICFISLFVYFELVRSVRLDIVDFTNNVYEKDFFERSFAFVNNFPDFKFSKSVESYINGETTPVDVEAYFSQEHGWPKSFCHIVTFSITGKEKIQAVINHLKTKFGTPTAYKTTERDMFGNTTDISFAYWTLDDGTELIVPSEGELDKLDKASLIRNYIRPSRSFLLYIIAKKWLISKLPESLKPEWSKVVSQARMTAEL